MADTIYKNTGAVSIHGGGYLKICPVSADGLTETPPWVDIGTIQTFSHKDDTTVKKEPDETGNTAAINLDVREVVLTGLIMESDMALINYLKDTVRDNFYRIYKYNGIVNSLHQEIWYAMGKLVPKIDLTSGTKRIPFEIHLINNPSAITIAHLTAFPDNAYATADVVIPANGIYTVSET